MILSCKYTIYISNNYYDCTTFFQPNILFIYQIIITIALHFFSLIKHSKNFKKKETPPNILQSFFLLQIKQVCFQFKTRTNHSLTFYNERE